MSKQQHQIAELYTKGHKTNDIAEIMALERQTVLNH
ncbi:LuxR C-terminal-related transcriptional regulator [Ruthenibacterium lactatiformans]